MNSSVLAALFLAHPVSVTGVSLVPTAAQAEASHYPKEIAKSCRGGRAKLYDECGSQQAIFDQAQAEAERSGKTLLVVYGAEWCIWCHVFTEYVEGHTGMFEYSVEGRTIPMLEASRSDKNLARELAAYFDDTFVVAHIEDKYSPDGMDVLYEIDALEQFDGGLPYIFSLRDGKFAAAMTSPDDLPGLELREADGELFRGYNRALLLDELKRMATAAK